MNNFTLNNYSHFYSQPTGSFSNSWVEAENAPIVFNNKIEYCNNQFSRSKCSLPKGHEGRCAVYPLKKLAERLGVFATLQNAAFSTAGATAANSPIKNRASRWFEIQISVEEEAKLKKEGKFRIGIRKSEFATNETCREIYLEMLGQILNMSNCPELSEDEIKEVRLYGIELNKPKTTCKICEKELDFLKFKSYQDDSDKLESGHLVPLSDLEYNHKSGNLHWLHRRCNIAQNNYSVEETRNWILETAERLKSLSR
jgi:hypothetical protein